MNYKKKAWLIDDDCILYGYKDKYGFHPENKACGFDVQKISKRDINKVLFYDFKKALSCLKNQNITLNNGEFRVGIDAGLARTRMILAPVNRSSKSRFDYSTNTLYEESNIDALILEFFNHLSITKIYETNVDYFVVGSNGKKVDEGSIYKVYWH